jgi:Putative beta-barrel porin-2, OmpL-like. bbp2
MRLGSLCWLLCFCSLLFAGPQKIAAQQNSSSDGDKQKTEVARTVEDIREQILLDRVAELERRLEALEHPKPAAAATEAVIQAPTATPAAATPAPQAAAPAAAPEAAPPTWSVGPIDFSGLVDGYYNFNANHPASQTNQLYNFDVKANQFSLNMAKLSMSHSPDPVGFQVDLGFGRAFEIIHASEPDTAPSFLRNIEQAYVSLKPAKWKGLEIDFGQFVTSAGAEVIETQGNWNYSRSDLFALAIPYYHFGLRATLPIGKHFTGGFQLVNGWNNLEDNNSGKTLGFTGALTYTKFAWSTNYYTGPENPHTNTGWRNLFDTTLLLTPNSKINAYINFDYGQNRQNIDDGEGTITSFLSKWYGIAGALKFQPTSKWAFTPRIEWFKDRDGFSTGVSQDLKEFTLTGEYKMIEGLLGRLEYRHDWSNQPFFDKNSNPESTKHMDTVTLGVIAFFGPKR